MSRVVAFHFTLRDPAGRVLDTTAGGGPITFLEGTGEIIAGLDQRLRAVEVGVKTRVLVPAAEAYGERDPGQVRRVKRRTLPIEGEVCVGDQYRTASDRHAPIVTVAAIDGDEVVLDANHPLAGVDLTFDVEIVSARPATAEDRSSRHAHGADGGEHCH